MDEQEAFVMVTKEELVRQFKACGIQPGHTLLVHTSLSKLGFVVGGAETINRALLEVVGEEGTLMMPSQTWKNLDPSIGVHWEVPQEWWPEIRKQWPAYDKAITPAIGMGATAEMLRTWPGAHRSEHPARSFAAVGKHAEYLTADHDLSNIFGVGSPLDKLYQLNGSILLLGVGYDKCTSLHLAETQANFGSKAYADESSAILIDGERQWVTYRTQAVDDSDFVQLGEEFEKAHSIPVQQVGRGEIRLIPQRLLVDWAVEWMETNRS